MAENESNGHKRHGSIERYRPGAFNSGDRDQGQLGRGQPMTSWADEVESPPRQQLREPHQNGRGGPRRGGGRGRGRGHSDRDHVDPVDDLRDKLNRSNLGNDDLRHRLNQRSRAPLPPSQDDEANERENGNRGRGGGGNNRNRHNRLQGRGAGGGGGQEIRGRPQPRPKNQGGRSERDENGLPKGWQPPKRNTENFDPSHEPAEMRILCAAPGLTRYNREYLSRDVLIVNDLYCDPEDLTIYNQLLHEIKHSGVDEDKLWQSWHGDSHMIADDKRKWKDACPTFHMVLERIQDYFGMRIEATRLNWYRDSTEWKPFHHDAAALKADKARKQNFTVGVSFGMEREAAFEHAKTKTVIAMPQPNGTIYTFGKDVNIMWRHGITQVQPEKYSDQGRISIIAWGWIEQTPV